MDIFALQVRNHRLLAALISRWEMAQGPFGADWYLRLQRIWGVANYTSSEELVHLLCPLFAINQGQQSAFHILFHTLLRELPLVQENEPREIVTLGPQKTEEESPQLQAELGPSETISDLNPSVDYSRDFSIPPLTTLQEKSDEIFQTGSQPPPLPKPPEPSRPLVVELEKCENPPFAWKITPDETLDVLIETPEGWRKTLSNLRRREATQVPSLDVPASLRTTINHAGMPYFRYRRHTRPPEYLLLIERFSENDHRAHFFNQLYKTLVQNRIFVDRFFYTGDLRLCHNDKFPFGLRPSDLYYRYPNARLLIVGSGRRFISSHTGLPAAWVAAFKAWHTRILLTPIPQQDWGQQERHLQEVFTILPASVHSLQFIGGAAENLMTPYETLPAFLKRVADFEPVVIADPVIRSLRFYFSSDMICWIAACAIYPAIHYPLTLRLGRVLSKVCGYQLVTPENILAISRLSWFTEGSIPEQYRDELLVFLENRFPDRHRMVLNDLGQMMEKSQPPSGSVAWAKHQINLALLHSSLSGQPDENTLQQLREVIKRLDRPKKRSDFILPSKWEQLIQTIGLPENEEQTPAETEEMPKAEAPEIPDDAPKDNETFFQAGSKTIEQYRPDLDKINEISQALRGLSHDELRQKSVVLRDELKERLRELDLGIAKLDKEAAQEKDPSHIEKRLEEAGKLRQMRLSQIKTFLNERLPEAFALIKETCRRFKETYSISVAVTDHDRELAANHPYLSIQNHTATWESSWPVNNRDYKWKSEPYDNHLAGGIALHQGHIAEIPFGEGKELSILSAAYLNALSGEGTHVACLNTERAQLYHKKIGPIFEFLLLKTGCIDTSRPHSAERKTAYSADVTFGSSSEFGFDFLRDHMVTTAEELVQRPLYYAILEEADIQLIDEGRTPLNISGPVKRGATDQLYVEYEPLIRRMVDEQAELVSQWIKSANDLIAQGRAGRREGGLLLLQISRAVSPKNYAWTKLISHGDNARLLQDTAKEYPANNTKLLKTIDQNLFFTLDEKQRSVELTEKGIDYLIRLTKDPDFFTMPDLVETLTQIDQSDLYREEKVEARAKLSLDYANKSHRIETIRQLLKAYTVYEKDREYLVRDGAVEILDEQSGRVLEGRKFADGLHQAIEAKEHLRISELIQSYASILGYEYVKKHPRLAGVAQVAQPDKEWYAMFHNLQVVSIPSRQTVVTQTNEYVFYRSLREKYNRVTEDVVHLRDAGRPVLVVLNTLETTELLSRMLKMRGITHQVLNIKTIQHKEGIEASAGIAGTITLMQNVADIFPEILIDHNARQAGGLAVIITERSLNERVDLKLSQLANVNGNPGSTSFIISLEDEAMRNLDPGRVANLKATFSAVEGEPLHFPGLAGAFAKLQKENQESRLRHQKIQQEYDKVLALHTEILYQKRQNCLAHSWFELECYPMIGDFAETLVKTHREKGDLDSFRLDAIRSIGVDPDLSAGFYAAPLDTLKRLFKKQVLDLYERKFLQIADRLMPIIRDVKQREGHRYKRIVIPYTDGGNTPINISANMDNAILTNGASIMQDIARVGFLAHLDNAWIDHLQNLKELKEHVQHANLINQTPLTEYLAQAGDLFDGLLQTISTRFVAFMLKGALELPDEEALSKAKAAETLVEAQRQAQANRLRKNNLDQLTETQLAAQRAAASTGNKEPVQRTQPIVREKTIGRNDPCPCGSGKKYKHCHGK